MTEIHLDIEDKPETLDDARFIYTAGQIAQACQANKSRNEASAAKDSKLFRELIVSGAPHGVTIDPDALDLENLPISSNRSGTSTIMYSSSSQGSGGLEIPMSNDCEKALRSYQNHRYQIRTWSIRQRIFSRETSSRPFSLSLHDIEFYELYTSA